jgi:glycosyltransferase involved in cell wall biosynthesis
MVNPMLQRGTDRRLLFLCQTLPYPPDGGVWIRTYHVLRLLSQAFDITALCFERAGSSCDRHDWTQAIGPEALGRFAKVEVFTLPQKHSRLRFAWDHLRSVASQRVYTSYLYESPAYRRRVTELVRSGTFDLVHVDSLDLAGYLGVCGSTPVVCVHHDIESTLLRRRAALDPNRWRGAYLQYQGGLMERVERHWCERVALNVTVSDRDRATLKRLAPRARVAVVPNGVDLDGFRADRPAASGIAYVGGTSPFPNLDALHYFCESILPHVRASCGDVPVRWIGRATPAQQRHYRQRFGVDLTGYVDDVRSAMAEAACHIVPLRTGGGTRLKILGSWAMGKPVVSTSIGCEGLAATDGDNILIRDDPREFADAVGRVLHDADLRHRLGACGRATAERLYGWDAIGRAMIETYRLTAGQSPAGAGSRTNAHALAS